MSSLKIWKVPDIRSEGIVMSRAQFNLEFILLRLQVD
jgi:hypothetical protein